MSLNWNIQACANIDDLKADTPTGWPVTDCTIWLCMIVGIDTITEQNAETFWHRVSAWETVNGKPINTSGRKMEPQDIVARIGLRTNASRLTDAQWRKKLEGILREESEATWRRTGGGMLTKEQLDRQDAEAAS